MGTTTVRLGVGGGAPMGAAGASGDEPHAAYATLARDRDLLVEKLVEAGRVHKATSAVRGVGSRPPPCGAHHPHNSLSRRARSTVAGPCTRRAACRVHGHGDRSHRCRMPPQGRTQDEPMSTTTDVRPWAVWAVWVADVAHGGSPPYTIRSIRVYAYHRQAVKPKRKTRRCCKAAQAGHTLYL